MNETSNLTLTELGETVNHIFECDERISRLRSEAASMATEMMLIEHLARAFQIIDEQNPFAVN